MADQILTTGKFKALKYLPSMLPEAVNLASLASGTGQTQLWQYGNIQTASSNRLVTLRALQHVSSSGVNLFVAADKFGPPAIDTVGAALFGPEGTTLGPLFDAVATSRLIVSAQNQSGVTVDNVWANASVLVERPSIAQLQKMQVTLTDAQQALATKYASGARGVLPRRFEWIRDNEYKTQIVDASIYADTLDVAAGASPTFFQVSADSGEMLVMAGLAVTAGSGTDGLTTLIQADDELAFLSVPNYPAGQGKPIPLFLQAAQQFIVTATATTAVNNVSIAALVWHVRLTDEISYRMGNTSAVSQALAEKITVGVV